MKLGALLGGYRTSVKAKLGRQYQKWLESVQSSGNSANKHFEELVRYELQNGIIDFSTFSPRGKKEAQQAAQVTENLGMLGMIQKMSDMMATMAVNNATDTVQQTQALAIAPLQEQVAELRQQKSQGMQEIEALRAQWDEMMKGTKDQKRMLADTQEKIQEANQELAKLQAKVTNARAFAPVQQQAQVQYVPSGESTDGEVPEERDAKGRFKKRSKGWVSEAPAEGEGKKSKAVER
jgi:chromosome segregation ATPase